MKSNRLFDIFGSIQDYLAEEFGYEVERWQVIAIVLLSTLLIMGGATIYLKGRLAPQVKTRQIKEKPAEKVVSAKVLVYVCGAVRASGVYSMPQGTRVNDAITQAGGALPEADLRPLNLAKQVSDGEKIFVPKTGESVTDTSLQSDVSSQEKVNLNSASVEELDRLPGIGPAFAKRILSYRQEHGRFTKTEQLQEVQGIGPKKYDQIKDQVTI